MNNTAARMQEIRKQMKIERQMENQIGSKYLQKFVMINSLLTVFTCDGKTSMIEL